MVQTPTTKTLSKSNAHGVKTARLHLRIGTTAAYTQSMAGLHRAASPTQQKLIWAEVLADEMQHHFTRIHDGKTLLAIEVARDDDDLVLVEMAA